MVSKFIKRGANKENLWEHGNIGQFLVHVRVSQNLANLGGRGP